MPKAAVLPLPVGALAKMSWPASATGTALRCIGVASRKRRSSMPRRKAASSVSSEKMEILETDLYSGRNLSTTRKIALEDGEERLTGSPPDVDPNTRQK
jgi:hypothetical protein